MRLSKLKHNELRLNQHIILLLLAIVLAGLAPISSKAQNTYTPHASNLAARQWFRQARFGMFIHWGIYSTLGDAEWVMQNQDIPASEYEKLAAFFNPVAFSAQEWVELAKMAGMKYITITTKHHDGFAMYDSKISNYDIVDSTPYGKDIFRMLEQECKKQGIKLFAYYSQLDWHHPDYFPRGWTGRKTERPDSGDFENYLAYQDAQMTELAQNYDIAGFWLDGWWDQQPGSPGWPQIAKYRINGVNWHLERTYAKIHAVKPHLLIGNNHHVHPFAGEDFQMFEKDLPGSNTAGFNTREISALPLETCETMNGSWGFRLNDRRYKSSRQLIQYLVKAAGHDANFLLNVGPMPNGKIQPEFVDTLKVMGEWLKKNGETIYGTRGGPVPPAQWGVSTQAGNRIFLHILNPDAASILLADFVQPIRQAFYFSGRKKVEFRQVDFGTIIRFDQQDDVDTIIVLELADAD